MKKYYWLNTDYHYADYSAPKWALVCGCYDEDGEKDRDSEEVVCWAPYENSDSDNEAWDDFDNAIIDEIGFLPDYEVN